MKLQGLDGNAVWETEPQGRLLVIDDDPFLRATLREQFAAEGFGDVAEAENLVEAFRRSTRFRPTSSFSISAFRTATASKSAGSFATAASPSRSSC